MMDSPITLQDVANIVSFIAPGYFAMQVYSVVYTKRDRDFSRLFVESIIYSLPILTLANIIWQRVLGEPETTSINIRYALILFGIAVVAGFLVATLRTRWPFKQLAILCGFGLPDEDFVKTQLLRINVKNSRLNAVTVKLKSGSVFSATVDRLSRYSQDGPKYYSFTNLAWLTESGKWDERDGNLIIARDEIEYIETRKLQDDQAAPSNGLGYGLVGFVKRLRNRRARAHN